MIVLFGTSDYITEMGKKHSESADLRRSYLEECKTVLPGMELSTPKCSRIFRVSRQTYPEYFIKIHSGVFWMLITDKQTDKNACR